MAAVRTSSFRTPCAALREVAIAHRRARHAKRNTEYRSQLMAAPSAPWSHSFGAGSPRHDWWTLKNSPGRLARCSPDLSRAAFLGEGASAPSRSCLSPGLAWKRALDPIIPSHNRGRTRRDLLPVDSRYDSCSRRVSIRLRTISGGGGGGGGRDRRLCSEADLARSVVSPSSVVYRSPCARRHDTAPPSATEA